MSKALSDQLAPAIKNNFTLPLMLYQDSSDYTVSNIDITELVFLASSLATNYSGMEILSTDGTYKMEKGDASAQYILDQESFFETILSIYYIQID